MIKGILRTMMTADERAEADRVDYEAMTAPDQGDGGCPPKRFLLAEASLCDRLAERADCRPYAEPAARRAREDAALWDLVPGDAQAVVS